MELNWFDADYLPWLILLLPLLSFAIIALVTTGRERTSQGVAVAGIALS